MQRIPRLAANQRYPSCRKLSWLPRAVGGSKEGRFLDDAGYDFAPNRRAGAPPENVTSAIATFNQQSRCAALVPDRFAKFWKG